MQLIFANIAPFPAKPVRPKQAIAPLAFPTTTIFKQQTIAISRAPKIFPSQTPAIFFAYPVPQFALLAALASTIALLVH